jgi:DNA-binding transcriptional MerR regulator
VGGEQLAHTVKVVAELTGITVRMLHHYDKIGLLKPAQVSAAGYRLYTDHDLERLQQVLFFRELGFGLPEIKAIVDSPGFDRKQALLEHRRFLLERQSRLGRLIHSVNQTIMSIERGIPMSERELFAGFDPAPHEEEARKRWGHTKAFQESQARTKHYTQEDWASLFAESAEINQAIAALMDRSPADPEVLAWIAKHHQQINDRFFQCPAQIYRSISDGYVADERFAQYYEKIKPGMAQFMRDAVHAYCDKLEGK